MKDKTETIDEIEVIIEKLEKLLDDHDHKDEKCDCFSLREDIVALKKIKDISDNMFVSFMEMQEKYFRSIALKEKALIHFYLKHKLKHES